MSKVSRRNRASQGRAGQRKPTQPSPTTDQSQEDSATWGAWFTSPPTRARRLEVPLRACPELADLVSIFFGDLLVADMAAFHINDKRIQDKAYIYLRRACWEGAIIAYGRCFGSGRGVNGARHRLDSYLDYLSDSQRACHEKLLALRDRRIGHIVTPNDGQTMSCFFAYDMEAGNVLLERDIRFYIETEMYDRDLLKELQEITTLLRGKVGERIDTLRFKLINQVQSQPESAVAAINAGRSWTPPPD
jgi:hypothetical protein